jgi:predicted O-methyltransferase YrrM
MQNGEKMPHIQSLLSPDKLNFLNDNIKMVSNISGNFAQLGIYQGGSTIYMAGIATDRKIVAFDNFNGLPSTNKKIDGHNLTKGDYGNLEVKSIKKMLTEFDNIQVVSGIFPKSTTTAIKKTKFALALCEGKTYKSTLDFCKFFWPKLNPGGIMLIDDFRNPYTPGVEKAVMEFFKTKEVLIELSIDTMVRIVNPQ